MLFPASAQAQIVGFSENFDGPTLDPAISTLGDPDNHVGFDGMGQYCLANTAGDGATDLNRSVGGTNGDFTASATFEPTVFLGTNSDIGFRFFGADGFVEVVWNSFNNVRVFHNDFSTAGAAGAGNLDLGGGATQIPITGFMDGDSVEFDLTYLAGTQNISVNYTLNGGASQSIFSGTGFGDGFGDFVTNFTGVRLNQFNANGEGLPIAKVDSFSVQPLAVPEPGSLAMMSSVLLLMGFRRRRS